MERGSLPKSPRLSSTLVPINAGHLNFKAFMIAFSMDTTAPGFVTKSFKLVGFRNFIAAAPNPAALPAASAPAPAALKACASVATANSSGARFFVNLSGNVVINFCKKLGRWS